MKEPLRLPSSRVHASSSARSASSTSSWRRAGSSTGPVSVTTVSRARRFSVKRARLVGHDEVDGAERLLRIQAANQDASPQEPVGAEPEDHSEEHRRLLGDGRDRRGDSGQNGFAERRTPKEPEAHRHDDETDGDDQEDPNEAIELALQRGPASIGGTQGAGDQAELAVRPGGDDDAFAPPEDDARPGVGDRPPVGQRRVDRIRARGGFLRQGLSGQDAAVDGQRVGAHDPEVGWHDISDAEEDDVAGNELAGRNLPWPTVAADAGQRRGRGAQLLEGALGAKLA